MVVGGMEMLVAKRGTGFRVASTKFLFQGSKITCQKS